MFVNYKKIIIYIISLILMLFISSCTTLTLRVISYNDAVYKLTNTDKNRFIYTNANNEKIICTFNTNIFTYNSFNFELANDLYKVSVFNNSVKIECPSGRILTSYFNDKNEINSLSASASLSIYEADLEKVRLAQNIYAARGIRYIGWAYIIIIMLLIVFGIISIKSFILKLNYRTYNYNRNSRNRLYYKKMNYKKPKKSYYNNYHYKNKSTKRKAHANTNRTWYNKEVKTKTHNNKIPYYVIVNLFIIILIGALIYMIFYM